MTTTGETVAGLWVATLVIGWLCLLIGTITGSYVAGGIVAIALGLVLMVIGSVIIARAQARKVAEAQAQLDKLEALAQAVREQATADRGDAGPGGAAWGDQIR